MNIKTRKNPKESHGTSKSHSISHQSADTAQQMRSHSEHIRFQIESLLLEDDDLSSYDGGSNEYLTEIASLITEAFNGDDIAVHEHLVSKLSTSQSFIQEYAKSYRTQQQLAELFYDLSLLLARRRPKNTLDKSESVTIFTSCQHQFDLKDLVDQINQQNGVFQRPLLGQLFSKRDRQLIKLAADEYKLAVVSEPSSTSSREQMENLGISFYPVKIVPRAQSERARDFDAARIYQAVYRAFLDVYKDDVDQQACMRNAETVTVEVITKLKQNIPKDKIEIEQIQSQIEYSLMELSFHDVARAYVLYRDEKGRVRRNRLKQLHQQVQTTKTDEKAIVIKMPTGNEIKLYKSTLAQFLSHMFEGYSHLNQQKVLDETYRTIFNGIEYTALLEALVMSCRCLIESHPDYSFIAARILRKKALDEGLEYLEGQPVKFSRVVDDYASTLSTYVEKGIQNGILNPDLAKFDHKKLAQHIDCQRDFQFTYLGLQTLYDRYFIHDNLVRYELPQVFFMRVAMGLALNDKNHDDSAMSYYDVLSTFEAMSSTPTLFNAGTIHSQLSSCYLSTIPDDLNSIYSGIRDNVLYQNLQVVWVMTGLRFVRLVLESRGQMDCPLV